MQKYARKRLSKIKHFNYIFHVQMRKWTRYREIKRDRFQKYPIVTREENWRCYSTDDSGKNRKEEERKNCRRSRDRKFRSILSTIFSFLFFFVERNDRLKPGPSEHVHFFVNCREGVNDPKTVRGVYIPIKISNAKCHLLQFFSFS